MPVERPSMIDRGPRVVAGWVFAAICMSEMPLFAYLDPGSGSMLTQLMLGGVAGIALLLRLTWRELRHRLGPQPTNQQRPHDG